MVAFLYLMVHAGIIRTWDQQNVWPPQMQLPDVDWKLLWNVPLCCLAWHHSQKWPHCSRALLPHNRPPNSIPCFLMQNKPVCLNGTESVAKLHTEVLSQQLSSGLHCLRDYMLFSRTSCKIERWGGGTGNGCLRSSGMDLLCLPVVTPASKLGRKLLERNSSIFVRETEVCILHRPNTYMPKMYLFPSMVPSALHRLLEIGFAG